MTERVISGMQVPASTAGRQVAAAGRTVPKKLHPGVVQSVSGGSAQVLIGSDYKPASISPTAKAVQAGDAVSCEKRGGTWWVVAVDTWHEPPYAPSPSSVTPPSASAPPIPSLGSVNYKPNAPLFTPSQTVESLHFWARDVRTHLISLSGWLGDVRDAIIALNTASGQQRSAIATNADATNAARTVITSTRDVTAALRQGAVQDRVVT